ncbi:ABC transporter substrate-binding protein [Microbacterium murale]|uniref:Peptide/nickel transport system substrate-binding protein n=1 Tax=Microbacterium murale TaxID=1081040 RepID=A0ABU0P5T9_9MICO|nr:ABC transporter substrate-binding protein [Microbacterium murale]MDQ0642689.1 peptide/nickel transport system substrate-binding protein [Microbacterium murale]
MSRTRNRWALAALASAVAIATLTSCASNGGAPSSSGGDKTVTVAIAQDPENLNPVIGGSFGALSLEYNLFDQLAEIDVDGSVIERAATEWSSNADFTVWDFTLRDDILFHDGSSMTAADVVFSFEEVLAEPDSNRQLWLTDMVSVEAVDDTHVRFTLSTPFSEWPRQTTLISIVPQAVYEEVGAAAFNEAPVGSGPFRFESWKRGQSVVVTKFDDYFGGAPLLDSVDFVPVPADDARVTGVQSGTVDIAAIPTAQIDAVKNTGSADVVSVPSHQVVYLGFNTETGPLADAALRRAVSYAIDRDAIVETILSGNAQANSQLVAPTVIGFSDSLEPLEFDQEAAKAALVESGYAGEEIPFQYALDGVIPMGAEIAQAIAGQLDEVGINVTLEGTDNASYDIVNREHGLSGLFLGQFSPSILDAGLPLRFLFSAEATNYFDDATIEQLVVDQKAVADDARLDVISQIWAVNQDNAYVAPLYSPDAAYGLNPEVSWEPRPDGLFIMKDADVDQ